MQTIDEIRSLTPGVQWTNQHPINSIDLHLFIKETWKQQKTRLYALRKKEEHSRIIEAIKCREENFEENKGKMLSSALNRKRGRIDTTNIIYEGEFIEDPDLVKLAVRQSATKWTRKRILDETNPEWVDEYNPISTLQDSIFNGVTNPINSDTVREVLSQSPNNKAAGPSKLIYECWKRSPTAVINSVTILFNQILQKEKTPSA